MKLHFTSRYHPEGDGQTERTNQTEHPSESIATTKQVNGPISSFGLSITFGMISGSEVKLHVQRSSEEPEEV